MSRAANLAFVERLVADGRMLSDARFVAVATLNELNCRNARSWIRRRARRLARAFQLSRREAVANAWQDWTHFNLGAARRAAPF